MARSIRVEYEGAWYHVVARGNRREAIFLEDEDREGFLKALGEACEMTGWEIHGWVLMGNHYHLLIRTPEANLVAGMKWLQNTVTRRFNSKHRQWGRLFGDRYKAMLVEGTEEGGYYLETLLDYVHLNPVRAGLVRAVEGQSVMDYSWSSVAKGYAIPPGKRAKWMSCEEGLSLFGWKDTAVGRRAMVERLDRRARDEEKERCGVPELPVDRDHRVSELRRGWYWGSQAFGEKMLGLVGKGINRTKARGYRSAREVKAHGELAAKELLKEGLDVLNAEESSIREWKRGDVRKLALAILLRKHTTVPGKWIAERLHMGSAANVSQQVRTASYDRFRGLPPRMKSMLRRIFGQ